jgi:hypothetical protein
MRPVSRADHRGWCGTGGMSATSRTVAIFLALLHADRLDLGAAHSATVEDNLYAFSPGATMSGDSFISKGGLLPMSKDPKREFKAYALVLPDSDTAVEMQVNDPSWLGSVFAAAWDARIIVP